MQKKKISIIAALGKNTRAIGKKNGLIWKIKGDLPRFQKITTGHPIIMGRKTFESLPKGALPDRLNIVVTRQEMNIPGAVTATSLDNAIMLAAKENADEIFVIGGGEIFKQALMLADRLYLTVVDSDEPGDIFFPDYSIFRKVISEERHNEHDPKFSYLVLER